MTRRKLLVVAGIAFSTAVLILTGLLVCRRDKTPTTQPALKKVVINEAVRTLLYLPLYHALDRGYFRVAGLDVQIVTGGTATNSFAAMLSGEAQFSQADPMYVPISREKGSQTKVVAQVVARIAMWGLTMNPNVKEWTADTVRGKKISTHVRPMTAFTYAERAVRDLGLDPNKDVEIIQCNPGTELVPLLNGQADFAFTLEPSVSTATAQGAHVVLSFPEKFGDQVFTGLMTNESYLQSNRSTVLATVRAYQMALDDISRNTASITASAKKYFPQIRDDILKAAISRLREEHVFPDSVVIGDESWKHAVVVRVQAGDIRHATSIDEACDLQIMRHAARR